MRYKIGDRVKVKDLDWYNKNKNSVGHIQCGHQSFVEDMSEYCGQIATITEITAKEYYLNIDGGYWCWTDDMFEGLVEDKISFDTKYEWTYELECPEGYQFKDENGNVINATKIVLEKKKKEYPKTYEECCKVLGLNDLINMHLRFMDKDTQIIASTSYHTKTLIELNCLTKLLICRDAYWKLYGEEMGLGKPWKPDWCDDGQGRYIIIVYENKLYKDMSIVGTNFILVFPTKEMRDVFYDNFKELIEICKELL